MSDNFKEYFDGLVENAIPVGGQTPESLCVRLFCQQVEHIKGLDPATKQKAYERVGEIGYFLSKVPFIFNEFTALLKDKLGIKPSQLRDLIQRAKKKERERSREDQAIRPQKSTQMHLEDHESAISEKLKSELFQISQQKIAPEIQARLMAEAVLKYLLELGKFFFHLEHKAFGHCMFFNHTKKKLLLIEGDEFQSWLALLSGMNRSTNIFKYIFAAILDESLSGKNTTGIVPDRFWAARNGALYLSCGDGHVVKISASGVKIENNGVDNILFPVGYTLAIWELVEPADPFEKCRLFREMSFASQHGADLLRIWTLSLPTCQETKAPLVLAGGVGSGKTKAAQGVFELYGLFPRIVKAKEDGEADFWTSVDVGGLFCLDNADTKFKWLPDALAAAATNGKSEKRQLYTDSCIVRQHANSWLLVTSANPTFASDAGLADRLIVVRVNRRNETADTVLSREIAENRNAGLSWIAHALSKALADNGRVEGNLNKRHPDFAEFAVRLGRAIGRERETIDALMAAEKDKSLFNVENDVIGSGLINLIKLRGGFRGTANELLGAFKEVDDSFNNFRWSSRNLAKHLKAIWPHVQGVFDADASPGHAGILVYSISDHGGCGGFDGGFCRKPPTRDGMGFSANNDVEPTTTTNSIPIPPVSEGIVQCVDCVGYYPSYCRLHEPDAGWETKERICMDFHNNEKYKNKGEQL